LIELWKEIGNSIKVDCSALQLLRLTGLAAASYRLERINSKEL